MEWFFKAIEELLKNGVRVKLMFISQTNTSMMVEAENAKKCIGLLEKVEGNLIEKIEYENEFSLIAAIGGNHFDSKVFFRLYQTVLKVKMDVKMISSVSLPNISFLLVKREDVKRCLQIMHRELFEN